MFFDFPIHNFAMSKRRINIKTHNIMKELNEIPKKELVAEAYALYREKLVAYAYKRIHDMEDAEDAVQNAFFKRLLDHVEPADQEVFFRTMELIGKNLDEILKENG